MIAVTFALKSESSAFLRLLRETDAAADRHTVTGTLGSVRVAVLHTGVGEKIARPRLSAFLTAERPALLISAGFAGALHDGWSPGDLIIAQNFSSVSHYAAARMALQNHAKAGELRTVKIIIDSPSARADLARLQRSDAVDMETEFIAADCAAKCIPVISLRAISDTPAAPFPAPPTVLFDIERQETDLLRLLFYLAARPGSLVRFGRFARRIAAARTKLADGLQILLSDPQLLDPPRGG